MTKANYKSKLYPLKITCNNNGSGFGSIVLDDQTPAVLFTVLIDRRDVFNIDFEAANQRIFSGTNEDFLASFSGRKICGDSVPFMEVYRGGTAFKINISNAIASSVINAAIYVLEVTPNG